MATELTAENLAQRALDVNVISEADLQSVWSELGTRNVSCEQFSQLLVRRDLLTNYQLDRLHQGFRSGFFYGDYKVLYMVGAGTFARVYRVTEKNTGELLAIKVLRKRMSEKPKEAELFRREGELGMTLKHPNIVAIHEVVSKGHMNYIVMDFVEGHNLRDFFKVRGKFDPQEAGRIVSGMLAGLNYAFQQGVTHRDLKMSNVIVSSDGQSKLIDFGLAGLGITEDDATGDGANPRTIDYAGLERATNVRKDDTRSDIFFVGSIIYQLLCGRPALVETRDRAQRLSKSRYQDFKPIVDIAPELPLAIVRVANKALEFDPDRRYQTPGEMLTDLQLAMRRAADKNQKETDTPVDSGPMEGHDDQGEPRRLMVVESDTKLQDLFREMFKKRGYRVLVTSDPERLFQRFYENTNTADVVLLSSGHLGASALEAFNRMGSEAGTKTVPALLLLGDQHAQWNEQAQVDQHRGVLQMPVKSRELRSAILKVLKGVC
jgi:serine/threonine protein kinase